MDKLTALVKLERLIDREQENTRIYCELNPGDAKNRRERAQLVISAYIEAMQIIID